jgi:hypothetical protein
MLLLVVSREWVGHLVGGEGQGRAGGVHKPRIRSTWLPYHIP